MERLTVERFSTVTLEDGSVLVQGAMPKARQWDSTKKGARSYDFCTVAQTDQVLDVHHRPGNVDSNGADTFIERCRAQRARGLPRAKTEVRIDSAFFNETIVERLHTLGVKFTISVPFERFARLKELVEGRRRSANGRWARLFRDPLETEVEHSLSLHLLRKQVRC